MKYLVVILVMLLAFSSKAQQRYPAGFPTQFNTGWNRWGYAMSDSGLIVANRDTTWLPKFSGTLVFRPADKKFYYFDSTTLNWNLLVPAVTGADSLFGIKDSTSDVDRYMNMKGHSFTMDSTSDVDIATVLGGSVSMHTTNYNSILHISEGGVIATASNSDGNSVNLDVVPERILLDATISGIGSQVYVHPSYIRILAKDSIQIRGVTSAASADSVLSLSLPYVSGAEIVRRLVLVPKTNSGTVTSVGLSMPSAFTVTGSPITTTGTFSVSGAGATTDYIRGNGTLATTDTGMIPGFYLKVRSLFSGTSPITYNSTTGAIGIPNGNASGTKGAVTFNNGSFSDNGAGLISLTQPVAPGSCTNCGITWGTDGRPTAYSTGTGPSGASVDTIYRTPGIDSTYFTINSVLYAIKDSSGAGSILQNIQQTLNTGDTSNRPIVYKFDEDTTAGKYTFNGIPSNFGTNYGVEGEQMGFSSGWIRYNYVNASGRPNVIWNLAMYNTSNGGGRISVEEAAYRFGLESHFNISGQRLFEFHLPEVTLYDGTVLRPNSLYINKETGGTQFTYFATDLVTYTKRNGDNIFAFGATGGFTMVGNGDAAYLHILRDSATGTQYHINIKDGSVEHKTFSAGHIFDSQIHISNELVDNPILDLSDSRNTTPGNYGINLQIGSVSQSKVPLSITAQTTGGMTEQIINNAGSNVMNFEGNGNARITIRNLSTTDPAGGGYTAAFNEYVTGSDNAFIGMNFGTSAGPYIGTQLFYRTITSAPQVWYVGTPEKMRLNAMGLGIGTTTPSFGLHVNRTLGANKDSLNYQSTVSTRQMLVIDTATGKFQRMDIPVGGATTIYNGDGTLAADRNVASGGFTLRFAGANNSDTIVSINNTGTTGLGLYVAGTALGISTTSSSGTGLVSFGSTRGATITGDTDEGLLVKSNAVRGARIQTVPATTNTVVEVLQLERGVNGSPGASGIGEYVSFLNKTSDNSSSESNTIISKFTDATTATRTSQFIITGVSSASSNNILTIDGDGSITTIGKRTIGVTTSSAGTLTLGNSESYIFNGTTTTWTLPAVSGTTGRIYYIKNIGSGSVTLNAAAAANEIYSSSAVNTVTVTAGSAIILISNGTYFTVN